MTDSEVAPITELLRLSQSGDIAAEERLYKELFSELRRIAAAHMRKERSDHTLQPTALVNEAYVRLAGRQEQDYSSKAHFMAAAAQVMHHILVDYARQRRAGKRFGNLRRVVLDEAIFAAGTGWSDQMLTFERHMNRLAEFDERGARIVKLKFFAGMTDEEIAGVVGISSRTVKRDYKAARVWLASEMSRDRQEPKKRAAAAPGGDSGGESTP